MQITLIDEFSGVKTYRETPIGKNITARSITTTKHKVMEATTPS